VRLVSGLASADALQHGVPPVAEAPPTKLRSPALLGTGITLDALAIGSAFASLVLFEKALNTEVNCTMGNVMVGVTNGLSQINGLSRSESPPKPCPENNYDDYAVGFFVAANVLLAAGIPLTILGSRKVPQDSAAVPEVRLGFGSGSLTWSF